MDFASSSKLVVVNLDLASSCKLHKWSPSCIQNLWLQSTVLLPLKKVIFTLERPEFHSCVPYRRFPAYITPCKAYCVSYLRSACTICLCCCCIPCRNTCVGPTYFPYYSAYVFPTYVRYRRYFFSTVAYCLCYPIFPATTWMYREEHKSFPHQIRRCPHHHIPPKHGPNLP